MICVSVANGGLNGPVDGFICTATNITQKIKISVLRLDYRKPNDFSEYIIDILASCSFQKNGASSIVLLGHSLVEARS